ncbi:uncharacterized protein J3D65DRAFT_135553 [Phyllosticta citribraziliensis]|uniref:Uncharacterized protein n=1 Tax=Phyllosticta citribraziliensis TaxID=989973 RepID=A0ABR1LAQ3_9PEZI
MLHESKQHTGNVKHPKDLTPAHSLPPLPTVGDPLCDIKIWVYRRHTAPNSSLFYVSTRTRFLLCSLTWSISSTHSPNADTDYTHLRSHKRHSTRPRQWNDQSAKFHSLSMTEEPTLLTRPKSAGSPSFRSPLASSFPLFLFSSGSLILPGLRTTFGGRFGFCRDHATARLRAYRKGRADPPFSSATMLSSDGRNRGEPHNCSKSPHLPSSFPPPVLINTLQVAFLLLLRPFICSPDRPLSLSRTGLNETTESVFATLAASRIFSSFRRISAHKLENRAPSQFTHFLVRKAQNAQWRVVMSIQGRKRATWLTVSQPVCADACSVHWW